MQNPARNTDVSDGFLAHSYLSGATKQLWKYKAESRLTSALAERKAKEKAKERAAEKIPEKAAWRVARTVPTVTSASAPKQLAFDFWYEIEVASRKQSPALTHLEVTANAGDESAFLVGLENIKWQGLTAPEFVKAIKLAFKAGAFTAARKIAHEGMRYHPDNADVQKYYNILNPVTRVVGMTSATRHNAGANRAWLKENAGKYRGQWLALRDGELLGVSPSLDTLTEEVSSKYGVTFPSKEVMITAGY